MYQVKKISDDGTNSPFIARFFGGIFDLRNQLFLLGVSSEKQNSMRDNFDKKYKPLLESAQAVRDAAIEIKTLVSTHLEDIGSGKIVRFSASQYDILKTIDASLGQSLDKLINQSIVATKTCLQSILRDPLGLEIGFFFQADKNFYPRIKEIRESGDNIFAKYLEDARIKWHAALQELRRQQEHEGWSLKDITYHLVAPNKVEATLPSIDGILVDAFAGLTANRVLLFIENMMVYAMQRNIKFPIYVVEIPRDKRDPNNLERFRIVPRGLDTSPPWILVYKDDDDFV
jgi:hypothetical protein